MGFLVGERVCYSNQVCKIEGITAKNVGSYRVDVFELYSYSKPNIKMFIPVDKAENLLRPLASKEDFYTFTNNIRQQYTIEHDVNVHWKKRIRAYREKLKGGAFSDLCEIFLYFQHKEHITLMEEEIMTQARELIIREISFSLSRDASIINNEIDVSVREYQKTKELNP